MNPFGNCVAIPHLRGAHSEPIYVHPNDSDPFPSDPHGHVGSPTSKVKVDVNTGKIFNGTKPTGQSLSSKGLATLRSALRNTGFLGLGIKLGELATAPNASALGDILDPGFMIGGNLSGDDMLPFPGNPGGREPVDTVEVPPVEVEEERVVIELILHYVYLRSLSK